MLGVAVWWWGGDGLEVSVHIYAICCVVSAWSLDFIVDVADVDDFGLLLVAGCCFAWSFDGDSGVLEDGVVCDAFACLRGFGLCWYELYSFVLSWRQGSR